MALLSLTIQYIIVTKTTEHQGWKRLPRSYSDHIQCDLNLEMEKLRLREMHSLNTSCPLISGAESQS